VAEPHTMASRFVPDRPSPTVAELQDMVAADRLEDVAIALRGMSPFEREDPKVALIARRVFGQIGEVSRALGEANRLARTGTPDRLRQARFTFGKLRETDTDWLPQVPSDADLSFPATPSRILHHLKESLPYSESGFTFRSRMTLNAQRLAGFEPVVATSLQFPLNRGAAEAPDVESVEGVTHHRLLDPSFPDDISRIPYDIVLDRQAALLARVTAAERPSIIQAGTGYRGFDTALCALSVARRADVPCVYEVRGFQEATWTSTAARAEVGEYFARRRDQEMRCFVAADGLITIGEAMKDEIASRGIDPDLIHVVPNAVDVERFSPRVKREDLLERYSLTGRFVVGYISNLGRREGIDTLILAVAEASRRVPDIACLIVGDGPERTALADLAASQPNADQFHLIGHVPNSSIEDHYALIDLFVVPRKADRAARLVTPLKPLEAMAMGIPLITSDLPALNEIVAPGERGLNFASGDPRSLAQAIVDLAGDAATAQRFAQAGREWVTRDRTVASNAERYQRILSVLV
jgi:glycosyltransferase involved in cell wall biosynthesis